MCWILPVLNIGPTWGIILETNEILSDTFSDNQSGCMGKGEETGGRSGDGERKL